jgi:hypothetical protein
MRYVWGLLLVCSIAWSPSTTPVQAGIVFLAGDSNINNPINGSSSAPVNAGNATFFRNVLGSSSRVLIQNEYSPPESGDGTTAINTLYNSISGVVSTTDYPGAEITSGLLSNVDFLIIRPRLAFTPSEIDALRGFVAGPGKLFLVGENSGLNIAQATVNELLAAIGSSMRLQNVSLGSGYQTTTNIESSLYTAGVTSISYNFTNSIGGGTPLVRSVDPGSPVIVAFENIQAIPEPSSLGLLFVGMTICVFRARHLSASAAANL